LNSSIKIDLAMEMAQKPLSLDGTLAEAYALVSPIYLAKGQYEKAIFEGEKACALDPNPIMSSQHSLIACKMWEDPRKQSSSMRRRKA
jgi:tetratricopeptide (TPR) repeat protein